MERLAVRLGVRIISYRAPKVLNSKFMINKYGSVQELQGTFGRLISLNIPTVFVYYFALVRFVWVKLGLL